jgi:hypothetical protein
LAGWIVSGAARALLSILAAGKKKEWKLEKPDGRRLAFVPSHASSKNARWMGHPVSSLVGRQRRWGTRKDDKTGFRRWVYDTFFSDKRQPTVLELSVFATSLLPGLEAIYPLDATVLKIKFGRSLQ